MLSVYVIEGSFLFHAIETGDKLVTVSDLDGGHAFELYIVNP